MLTDQDQLNLANEWNFVTTIAVFHREPNSDTPSKAFDLAPVPPAMLLPGVAFRVARTSLGITQVKLAHLATCAQVTVNNIENSIVRPTEKINNKPRSALEKQGAQFVFDGEKLTILTITAREILWNTSRSSKLRGAHDRPPFSEPPVKKRGRPPRKRTDSI